MNDNNIPKYMQNDKILIAVFIAIFSSISFHYRVIGDLMVVPLFVALIYLIPTIGFRSFLYMANNNSLWTRLILVLSFITFLSIFIWLIFFIDIEVCQYIFRDTNCKLSEKIGLGIIYSIGITSIVASLLVLLHKVLTFIKNG